MRRIFACLIVFAALTAMDIPQARAAGQACYRPDEAQAEQGVRIKSELMVIGFNCAGFSSHYGSQNLAVDYTRWVSQHSAVFSDYNNKLLAYYKRQGAKNPEASLLTLGTTLANHVATDAAHMRPDLFCAKYAPRIAKVSSMDDATIRRWAATFFPGHPTTHPLCEQ